LGEQVRITAAAKYSRAMTGQARPTARVLALGAVAGALLSGCGGGTQTVSVSNAPTAGGARTGAQTGSSQSTPPKGPATSTGSSASAPTPSTTAAPAGSPPQGAAGQATSTTRTAPAPAFLHAGGASPEETSNAEAGAAADTVTAHGYTPIDISTYHADQTLRVLIGTRSGSADDYDQRAFFFIGNRYLGTDSSQPSASIDVVSQSDTEVTLAYALYRPRDPLCCPSGGQATVHFQLDNGRLIALDPIPPVSSASGLARQ
jgi:LppP/LprE lipoprotein